MIPWMVRLVGSFLLEEVRLRGRFSPAFSLIMFPQMVLVGSMAAYLFHPLLIDRMTIGTMHFAVTTSMLVFGVTMGGLAFLGKEFIERSLGPVTMLAASTRYQPVSDRRMFLAYYLHDAVFFLYILLVPLATGIALGTIVHTISMGRFVLIVLSYWASFFLGLSMSMTISAAITNRRRTYLAVLPFLLVPMLAAQLSTGEPRAASLTYLAISSGDGFYLLLTTVMIVAFSVMGIFLFDGLPGVSRNSIGWRYGKALSLSKALRSSSPSLLARDMVGLARGKAYLGISFSLIVPMIVLVLFTGLLSGLGGNPFGSDSLFFSVMISIFSVSVYTNLVSLDHLDFDQTIPVDVPMMIRTKVNLHLLIALPISLIAILVITAIKRDPLGMLTGVLVGGTTVIYMGYVTAFLTGLWTNSMLFNAWTFLRYVLFTIWPMMFATVLTLFGGSSLIFDLFGPVAYIAMTAAAIATIDRWIDKRWDGKVLASGGLG